MKKRIVLFSCLLFFIVAALGLDTSDSEAFTAKYEGKEREEVIQIQMEMEIQEIFDEINYISSLTDDGSALIMHASTLYERLDEMSEELMVKNILDESNSLGLRLVLLDLYNHEKMKNQHHAPEIEALFLNEDTEQVIRHKLIWSLNFESDPELLGELQRLAVGDNEKLAFQAIKRLNRIDSAYAIALSDEILKDGNQPEEKVRIAIKVKAEELSQSGDPAEVAAFIKFGAGILDTSKDSLTRDTVIFALSSLQNEAALSAVLSRADVDEAIKCYCVEENYPTLMVVLQHDPTPESIELVIQASNIYRIEELMAPLAAAMAQYPDIQFTELLELEANPLSDRRKAL